MVSTAQICGKQFRVWILAWALGRKVHVHILQLFLAAPFVLVVAPADVITEDDDAQAAHDENTQSDQSWFLHCWIDGAVTTEEVGAWGLRMVTAFVGQEFNSEQLFELEEILYLFGLSAVFTVHCQEMQKLDIG